MRTKSNAGIVVKHARSCAGGDECTCKPTYQAWVWDRRAGRKVYKTFPTVSAAKQWRQDASGNVRRGTMRAPTSLTLEAAWKAWLEAAERGEILSRYRQPYKGSALRGYASDMRRFVLDDLGARRLADVTADDLQGLVDRLVGQGLSGSKVRNTIVPLQALYRKHRRQVLVDPTDGLDLPAPGGRRERVAPPDEAAKLLAAVPVDDRGVWATALYAGLRRGELRALRASDVLSDRISVERGWDDLTGPISPKSRAGVRAVPLPDTLRTILDAHLERTGRTGDELLFGRRGSEPFTPNLIARRADAAWTTAGLGRVTLHEARHSFGSYLDAAGISQTRSARYLGHSLPSISDRYRHALAGQLAEDAASLDAYLTGAAR